MTKKLTEEEKRKNLMKLIMRHEKKGEVVVTSIEGLVAYKIDHIIAQPLEGLLYDLNRLPEGIHTLIVNSPKFDYRWVNDYACYLVIKKLHESWKQGKT